MGFHFTTKPPPTIAQRAADKSEASKRTVDLKVKDGEAVSIKRVTIGTASLRSCRWPYGSGSDFHFCGQRTLPGSSWCEHHNKRAYSAQQAPYHDGGYAEKNEAAEDQSPIGRAALVH